MSRIHDALKKAEQERGSDQAADAVAMPIADAISTTVPLTIDAAATMQDIFPATGRTKGHLNLDDLSARCAHPRWHLDRNSNLFFNPDLSPIGAEQFRTLRSRLYQLRTTQLLRKILVTSSVAGEGKTFVTSNLAQAIVCQPDRRVLIIDADLRRSRLHVPFGAPAGPGLTDYLRGEADELAITQRGEQENLYLIPGGTDVTNPSELLSNGRLKTLLDQVTPIFDWVILDSPPCLPVADACFLAGLCDGVLLVVRAASTPCEIAQRSCQELQGRNVIGVVLNATSESGGYHPYYYYGYGKNGDAK